MSGVRSSEQMDETEEEASNSHAMDFTSPTKSIRETVEGVTRKQDKEGEEKEHGDNKEKSNKKAE